MGTEILIASLIAIALGLLLAGPLRKWREESRREEARRLRGTAELHALGAENQRVKAVQAQRDATSEAEAARAASTRRRAELELEKASREGERARSLDPDLRVVTDDLNGIERT